MAWFKADVGRQNRADPKWLLPMFCRRGKVTRDDIGAIRIHDTSTEFQVSAALAESFIANARKANADDVYIAPIEEGAGGPPPPRFRQRPDGGRDERPGKPPGKKRPPHAAKGKAERGGFKHRKNRDRS